MESFGTLAHERYSCRKFSERPVEAEKVDAILDAAVAAPTAVNRQPWHAWVIESPKAVETLRSHTRFGFGAPVYVVVGAKAEDAWVRPYDQRNFADVDASIVATHVMLAAADLGLGSTWVGHFDAPELAADLPQLAGYDLVAIFPLGYPAEEGGEPSSRHAVRKPREELVSRL